MGNAEDRPLYHWPRRKGEREGEGKQKLISHVDNKRDLSVIVVERMSDNDKGNKHAGSVLT